MRKYETTDLKKTIRVLVTLQNGTQIKHQAIRVSKDMLEDAYAEGGSAEVSNRVREGLKILISEVVLDFHDMMGFPAVSRTANEPKKSWWRRVFGG